MYFNSVFEILQSHLFCLFIFKQILILNFWSANTNILIAHASACIFLFFPPLVWYTHMHTHAYTRAHTRPFLYTGRSVYLPFAPDFLLSVRVVRKSPPAPPRGGPVPPRRRALCSGLRGSLPPALRPDERVSSVLAGVRCGPRAGPGRGGCGAVSRGQGPRLVASAPALSPSLDRLVTRRTGPCCSLGAPGGWGSGDTCVRLRAGQTGP